jgi:hypothetical protein
MSDKETIVTLDSNRPAGPEPFDPAHPATFPTQPVVPAPPVTPLVKPKSSSRILNGVLAVAVLVAIGGVSFAVGRGTAPVAANGRGNFGGGNFGAGANGSFDPSASGAPGNLGGGPGGGFGLGGGLTISGTVESVTGDSLTVTTASGQTVTLGVDGETGYHSQTDATAADVTPGSTVEVHVNFGAGGNRPSASADPSAPLGTASSVTVVP